MYDTSISRSHSRRIIDFFCPVRIHFHLLSLRCYSPSLVFATCQRCTSFISFSQSIKPSFYFCFPLYCSFPYLLLLLSHQLTALDPVFFFSLCLILSIYSIFFSFIALVLFPLSISALQFSSFVFHLSCHHLSATLDVFHFSSFYSSLSFHSPHWQHFSLASFLISRSRLPSSVICGVKCPYAAFVVLL